MTRSIFVACALAMPSIVQAQANQAFTLDQVLELADRQNPEVLIARAREVEARGRLTTASVRLRTIRIWISSPARVSNLWAGARRKLISTCFSASRSLVSADSGSSQRPRRSRSGLLMWTWPP
jgi:hypothetical protein